MRTQFFKDMVAEQTDSRVGRIVRHANVLMLEEVVGVDKAVELADMGEDSDNPYTHPEVYRAMLREQYMVRARTRAKYPKAKMA
jgi:hypothetical protein